MAHDGCEYNINVRVRGKRHFRPGAPHHSNVLTDFWTEIRVDFRYRDGTPIESSSSSSEEPPSCDNFEEEGEWIGRFPGVFIRPDWEQYAGTFTPPTDMGKFEEYFICGGLSMIPAAMEEYCTGWETPFCT